MLLVVIAVLCIASVPLAGRDLTRLAQVELRDVWAAFAAIALQVAITVWFSQGSHALHAALHVASYLLAARFLVANRGLPGLWVVAAGGAMNLAAITANGGVMPASPAALATAGITADRGFANSAAVVHPHLPALGDIIGIPGPWPIANVLSVGDLVLYAGIAVLLHGVCARPRRAAVT
jgi:Family of unknown function (DUF5317)